MTFTESITIGNRVYKIARLAYLYPRLDQQYKETLWYSWYSKMSIKYKIRYIKSTKRNIWSTYDLEQYIIG